MLGQRLPSGLSEVREHPLSAVLVLAANIVGQRRSIQCGTYDPWRWGASHENRTVIRTLYHVFQAELRQPTSTATLSTLSGSATFNQTPTNIFNRQTPAVSAAERRWPPTLFLSGLRQQPVESASFATWLSWQPLFLPIVFVVQVVVFFRRLICSMYHPTTPFGASPPWSYCDQRWSVWQCALPFFPCRPHSRHKIVTAQLKA